MGHYWEEHQQEISLDIPIEKCQELEELAVELGVGAVNDLISFLVSGSIPSKDIAKAIPILKVPEPFDQVLFLPPVTGISYSEKTRFSDEQKYQHSKYLFCVQILARIFGVTLCTGEATEEGVPFLLKWNKIKQKKDLYSESQEDTEEEESIQINLELAQAKEKEAIAIAKVMNSLSKEKSRALQELRQNKII